MANFKYNIGEAVKFKKSWAGTEVFIFITGRIMEECEGGIQYKYHGRCYIMRKERVEVYREMVFNVAECELE